MHLGRRNWLNFLRRPAIARSKRSVRRFRNLFPPASAAEVLEDRTLLSNITISDVSAVETDAGTTNFVFTVTRDNNTNMECVNYATADGTATVANSDYAATSAILCFVAGGPLSLPVTVAVNGDLNPEASETFFVNLTNPTGGAVIADSQGQGTIVDDDVTTVAISDVTLAEGNAGTTNFVFTVTLDQAAAGPFTVNYATADASAVAGSDYSATSGMLSFAGTAGEMQTIVIPVNGDTMVEADETFVVNLSNATGGVTIADSMGIGAITSDDTATLSIGNVTLNEGNAGTTNFEFTVTLDNAVQGGVNVNFATADGTAMAPTDYVAANGTLMFTGNAGEMKTITVQVNGDLTVEFTETFTVALSGVAAQGAGVESADIVAGPAATGTITNDDVPTPAPGTPTLTAPTATTNDTTPTIDWNVVATAVNYDLLVYDVVKGSAVVNQTGLTATEFTTAPLRQASYQAFVRAKNAGGNSDWSAPLAFVVALDPPMLTGPLTPSISAAPKITWTAVSGAVKYDLLVYHVATGRQVAFQASIMATEFAPGPLNTGDHQAFVRAIDNAGGAGPYSAPLNFNVIAPPQLTAPNAVTNDTTPTIKWTAVPGAASYELLVYNVATGSASVNETGIAALEFTPSSPLRQGLKQAFVRAIDAMGAAGNYSPVRSFTVSLGTSPLSVTVSNATPTISWSAIPGANAYELLVYNVNSGSLAVPPAITIATTLMTTPLAPGTYQVFVRGFDTFGTAGPYGPGLTFQIVSSTAPAADEAPTDALEPSTITLPPDVALVSTDAPQLAEVEKLAAKPRQQLPAMDEEPISASEVRHSDSQQEFADHIAPHTELPGSAITAEVDAVWTDWPERDLWTPNTNSGSGPHPSAEQTEATTAIAAALLTFGLHQATTSLRPETRSTRTRTNRRTPSV